MGRLDSLTAYITRRRDQIKKEMAVLESQQTNRNVLFARATTSTTARAVQAANSFTNGAVLEAVLEDRIQDILTSATPLGLNDSSPITSKDPLKLFLNEALVLLGLVLKANTSEVVRGMLSAPVASLAKSATLALEMASQAKSLLDQVAVEAIGQGIVLTPEDTRVTALVRNLTQAKDGADRLKANVSGAQAIGASLAEGVAGFLQASLDTLKQDTANLDRVRELSTSMANAGLQVHAANVTVEATKDNLINFRERYEANFSGISADLTQASALSSNIGSLLDAVVAARDNLTNLAPYRFEWGKEISVLLALAKESKPTAAQSIFTVDESLAVLYESLVANLKTIPVTDTKTLSASLTSIQGFLLGTFTSPSFKDQFDVLVTQASQTLNTYRDRMTTLLSFLDLVSLPATPVLVQLRDALEGSNLTNASDALENGDIETFLKLSVGNLNPVDQIREELLALSDAGIVTDDQLASITKSYQDILEFEQADMEAERVFEDSRLLSIAGCKSDLRRLDRVESLVKKIEAL